MTEKRIKSFYAGCVEQEWKRLIQDAYHRLELETTLHFLDKHIPKAARILDAGGGPGRYTIELARRGHTVVLLDLTPANLEFARSQIKRARLSSKVEAVTEGSIVDLSQFADSSFDAVVCLGGPLSHVLDGRKRDRAISELVRVCKKGAPLFVSVMGRLSVLVTELVLGPHELSKSFYKPMRDKGDYPGTSGFTACHFFLPEELMDAFSAKRVKVVEMVGLEGLGSHHAEHVNALAHHKKRWRIWLETHYQTCTHPSVVGTSEHLMIICKKSK